MRYKKVKTQFSLFFWFFIFSLLSRLCAEATAMPLLSWLIEEGENKFFLTAGPYFWFVGVVGQVFFFSFLFLRTLMIPLHKFYFLKEIKHFRDHGVLFDWKTQYKESLCTTVRNDTLAYAVWCVYPAICYISTWIMGYSPQEYVLMNLPNEYFVSIGFEVFKVQCFWFEVFYPFGIFCVAMGALVGVILFTLLYSLIITFAKQRFYFNLHPQKNKKLLIIKTLIALEIVIALICVLFTILN